MKKTLYLILALAMLFSLCACNRRCDAHDLLIQFVRSYGAEGIIYSTKMPEGEAGYLPSELIEKIFVFSGKFPENFAIFLNSRADFGSECGVFVCSDVNELSVAREVCLERISLLGRGSANAFIKCCDNVVFYSTMQDRERAEGIWQEIIR
jgi:hypothetical protein